MFVTAFNCTRAYRKGSANGIADFSCPFSRACYGVRQQWLAKLQPRAAAKPQPLWRSRYLPPTDLRAAHSLFADPRGRLGWTRALAESTGLGGLVPHTESTALGGLEPLAESTVFGGLVPRIEHAALGGLPLTSTTFHDFHTHEPRIRIGGLSASPGIFVARVSASVATTEGCTGRGSISPAADTVFASVFAIPIEGGPGYSDADRTANLSIPAFFPGDGPRSDHRFDCIRLRHAWHSSPSVVDDAPTNSDNNGKCTPAVDYEFGPGGAPRASSRRVTTPPRARRPRPLLLPTRRPARYHFRPTTTTQRLWELCFYGLRLLLVKRRLHLQGRMHSATLLSCGSRNPSRFIHMPIGSANNTRGADVPRHDTLHLYRPAVGPATRLLGMLSLAQASLPLRHPRAGG